MKSNIKIINENNGKHFSVVGDTYRTIISGKQTNGEYSIIDMLVPPGGGPPPHAHALFHESFYVVDGELEFKTEDGKSIAQKGDLVNIPKGGAIHSFKNTSNAMAHLLCTVIPAGLDEFFEKIGTPVEAGKFLPPAHLNEEEIKKVVAIAEKYGQVLYPPDHLDK